ncbi:GNAT family N-acetyltransferase [Erwinia amylovora]|uniref:GNAT family N-acetyltransferase n=3 Tax=Erwinia amylovora TaxID=552 RepID=A0ABX7MHK0_ERWAM|nr:GNAT family N-acetyltransferase [Erwinia amylovora]ATZ13003.1 GNAT family N-acetyltransferase [Erwinia amylovora]EKV52130.1 putative acetyltransferase [Erwinia amylovora ACW56400]MBZ2388364.1 GNAT family N-acetyltransferase [Erwinia amylovora]MBZ2394982.1 GNAT family N-acetyltransferase [Erwinia amylovora]MBZ2398227.1 GNAT family N-acetyltransferase [Erwinia amylovora]
MSSDMSETVIRHAVTEDAGALLQLYSQPDTMADTLQLPHPSLQKWQHRISTLPEGTHMLVACIADRIVGQVTVYINGPARRRHTASFGPGVDSNPRGKGVATAMMRAILDLCDNWLGVERVELQVFADNQAAIGLYERFGFATEGRARRFAVRNGQQVDALYMARFQP